MTPLVQIFVLMAFVALMTGINLLTRNGSGFLRWVSFFLVIAGIAVLTWKIAVTVL